MAVPVMRD